MESQPQSYPILEKGTVKDFDKKISNVGRPTVFIGSSIESKPVAEKIKACFPPEEFIVDSWYDGIFGKTKSSGGDLSNAEWLKNFTDIYDYAIFIFVPEDSIKSQTRYAKDNEPLKASATRHNVVFEFGLFMGKIGAKKSFILYDEEVDEFVKLFFTDLSENLNDTSDTATGNFKIELYKYKGDYAKYIENNKTGVPYDNASIEAAIGKIRDKIKKTFNDVDLGFLPATSLAIGYFNNCINIFATVARTIINNLPYPENWKKQDLNQEEFNRIAGLIKRAKTVKLKIVIPDTLTGALQQNINKDIKNEKFQNIVFPGANRPLTLACLKSCLEENSETLVFYDVPTTMNSSIGAIEMLTEHAQIRTLLNEKEIRNFKKALNHKINPVRKKEETSDIETYVEVISRQDFLKETGVSESKP